MAQAYQSVKMTRSSLLAMAAVLAIAACSPPQSVFYNRGEPESLLDVSSEVVSLSVGGSAEHTALANWISKDLPTRAELFCDIGEKECRSANDLLVKSGVPTTLGASSSNNVKLFYERTLARDCNARYIDKGFSLYNTPAPSFGCAISANMVQQVSDKREFTNPNLSDDPSAVGAVNVIHRAQAAKPTVSQPYAAQTTSATTGTGQ